MVRARGQKEAKGRKETKGRKTGKGRKYRRGQRKKAGQKSVLYVDTPKRKEAGEGRTATKAARCPVEAGRQKKAKYQMAVKVMFKKSQGAKKNGRSQGIDEKKKESGREIQQGGKKIQK